MESCGQYGQSQINQINLERINNTLETFPLFHSDPRHFGEGGDYFLGINIVLMDLIKDVKKVEKEQKKKQEQYGEKDPLRLSELSMDLVQIFQLTWRSGVM